MYPLNKRCIYDFSYPPKVLGKIYKIPLPICYDGKRI